MGVGGPMRPGWEAGAPDDTLVLDSVVARPFSIIWGDRRERSDIFQKKKREVRWIWTDMIGEECGYA